MTQSAGHKSTDAWIPKPGEEVGRRYRIEEHLDRGGMGVVLRATDLQTQTEVAMKLLSPGVAHQETYRKRFTREVQVIAKVEHPNVLRAYDFGESHGRLYIVTELLRGDSLKAVIRREGRLGTRRAIAIGREILRGLRAAHAVDIVHRDVKPENVFIETDPSGQDRVKVLDFGLAKSISSDENKLTATGMICGTASYVAPEILVTDKPEKSADVYATALVMLEMMFGRQVFSATSTTQTFMQQLVIPARIPRRLWDEPIGGVLARALNKHPDERYRDAGEMLEALEEVAAATKDFVLEKHEIPPRPPDDLSGFLLDHLADGANRTKATLRRLPRPEPFDSNDGELDDRQTLQLMIEEIVSGEHLDAFLDALDHEPREHTESVEVANVLGTPPNDEPTPRTPNAWKYALVAFAAMSAVMLAWVVSQDSSPAPLDAAPPPVAEAVAAPDREDALEDDNVAATEPVLVVEPIPTAPDAGVIQPEPIAAEPVPTPPEEPKRAAGRRKKEKPPAAQEDDAALDAKIERTADKLVEQYVPMP